MSQAAVIGAGAAGLAAALTLVRSGTQVTLYERGARAGGRMRTETIDGARVDVGVQLVSSTHGSVFELSRRAGAVEMLRRSPGRDALWRKGRAHPITYGSVTSMAASSALPALLKLKMAGRYLPFLTAHARGLDANDPAGSGGTAHDAESIGEWGLRELGEPFVELLAYPLLASYYGAPPERTSAAMYHALARAGLDVSVFGAVGGFGALADAWLSAFEAAGGRYVPTAEVRSVSAQGGSVVVETDGGTVRHDAAVVAVPARSAARLVGGDGLVDWLAGVEVQPTLTVAFRLDRDFPGDYFGLSFPRREVTGDRVVALCVQSRKLPGLVPPGGDAVVALPAPSATPDLLTREDDVVAGIVIASLERAVKGITKRVTEVQVVRFDDGYTVFEPGYLHHLKRFDRGWLPERIELAGDYLLAPTVEGAVSSGIRAAERVRASAA